MSDAPVRGSSWLPVPPHFDPQRIDQVWPVPYRDLDSQARVWRQEHGIKEAGLDTTRVLLMPVDMQNTFCLPQFELFVGGRSGQGSLDDVRRLCQFIYHNLPFITEIHPTLDTHRAMQIFHSIFWVDASGRHPEPYTLLSQTDVEEGVWQVDADVAAWVAGGDLDWLRRFARHYVERLSQGGKYDLTIWPYHAMSGGIGHALVSSLEEAIFFHGVVRSSQPTFEIKGSNPLTENYSVLRPEVLDGPDGEPIAHRNERFIRELLDFDVAIIAGEAKSHCVAWTIEDLLTEIKAQDPALVKKVYLLEDCTTPVVVPGGVDYTQEADEAFARFEAEGMHVVHSNQPMSDWPGFPLAGGMISSGSPG